jgi:outer membrane immunogenic protein
MAQDTAPDATFTGPRVEGVVGWDHVKDGSGGGGTSADGVVFGGQIGYDYQSGNVVFGAEGEVTGATTKDTTTNVLAVGDSLRVKAGRDLYAGARVGVVVGGRTLLYAKGGYTNAAINTRYVAGATTVEDKNNVDGFRVGAGAEVKLTDKVYAKAEYRYSNYSNLNNGTDIDLDRHQVVAGVGIRF